MVEDLLRDVFFDASTNEAVREGLPDPVVVALELITHLGDGATLIVLGALLYWFGADDRRDRRVLLMAIGVGALAISTGIKGIVALERPAAQLAFAPAEYGGYSFPSAHALGAAAVYGTLAVLSDLGRPWQRYVVAGTVIGLVALSRVVLGVHYLGDVVVGVVLGLAFVWLVFRSKTYEPGFTFVLGGLIAIIALALGSTEYTTMTVGAALGGAGTWWYVSHLEWQPKAASILVLAYLLIPLLLVFRTLTFLFQLHWGTEIASYALATAAVLLVPLVAERMNDWPQVTWLQEQIPTRGRIIAVGRIRRRIETRLPERKES